MALLSTFRDLFRDLSAWQLPASSAGVTIAAGRAQLMPSWQNFGSSQPNGSTPRTGEIWSLATYDARGCALTVELPQVAVAQSASGTLLPTSTTVVGLWTPGATGPNTPDPRVNSVHWAVTWDRTGVWGMQLQAAYGGTFAPTVLASFRLDTQEQRWLGITVSADGGTVTWYTSPDGFTWTQRAQRVGAVGTTNLASVRVHAMAWGGSGSTDDVFTPALLDNLNVDLTAQDLATVTGQEGDPFLAVDLQPDLLTGVFRVGASQLGGVERLAWSADDPATWVNIVCDVRSVDYQRGATRQQGVLTRAEAGLATVVVSDVDSRLDPNVNGTAIRKGTPARLRAWGYDAMGARWDAVLFTAELDSVAAQYSPDEDAPLVTLTLVDLVDALTSWESPGLADPGVGAGDSLLDRAHRWLQLVGRGEVSSASSDAGTYTATLPPTLEQKPWEELTAAQEAELGRLYVDRLNRLVVRSRGTMPSGPVRGTLSDVHGEAPIGVHCCIGDASIVAGPEGLANRVIAARRKLTADATQPATAQRDDELSQRLYGVQTVNRGSLELQTDAQAATWAGALITARTKPELRVEDVQPRPAPDDLDSAVAAWPAVLSTDLGDRWLFRYHPATGPAILRAVAVLGIRVQATPDGWTVTWTTEDAPAPGIANPTGWLVLGLSTVGGTDLLAPYPSPAR